MVSNTTLELNSYEYRSPAEDNLALMVVPEAVQTDESQIMLMQSPNRVLHDIVTHNLIDCKVDEKSEPQ